MGLARSPVQGLIRVRVQGLGLGLRVRGFGIKFTAGSGFRVWGLGRKTFSGWRQTPQALKPRHTEPPLGEPVLWAQAKPDSDNKSLADGEGGASGRLWA